jgi:hypothetical protein
VWLAGSLAQRPLSAGVLHDCADLDIGPLRSDAVEVSGSGLWLPRFSDTWERAIGRRLRAVFRHPRTALLATDPGLDHLPSLTALVDAVVERQRSAVETVDVTVGDCLDALALERWMPRTPTTSTARGLLRDLGRQLEGLVDRCLRLLPVDGMRHGARALIEVVEAVSEAPPSRWRRSCGHFSGDDALTLWRTEQLLRSSVGVQMTMTRSTGKSFLAMHVNYVITALQYRDDFREAVWLERDALGLSPENSARIDVQPSLHEDAPGARDWQVSWEAVADYLRHRHSLKPREAYRADGDYCGR